MGQPEHCPFWGECMPRQNSLSKLLVAFAASRNEKRGYGDHIPTHEKLPNLYINGRSNALLLLAQTLRLFHQVEIAHFRNPQSKQRQGCSERSHPGNLLM